MPRHPGLAFPAMILALVLGACSAQPQASAAPSESGGGASAWGDASDPSVAPSTDGDPDDGDTNGGASEEPGEPDDPGPFSCDLPMTEDATVARANIVDVRVGTHSGYDRVVFEFTDGLPEVSLERASPPFAEDGSGFPIEVEGESFLRLTMRGGTKQTEDGTSSYDGPTDFDPEFETLVDLIEGGDFEAQSTWYLGLSSEACVRVLLLDDAPRLVIDIEH